MMPAFHPTNLWRLMAILALALLSSGCASSGPPLSQLYDDYDAGRFQQVYQQAARATRGAGRQADEANYMAGMAAWRLGRRNEAIGHLRRAAQAPDPQLSGQALAGLGLVQHEKGLYASASDSLLRAGRRLNGEDQARAYYYAGLAQQKQGHWADARVSLVLARRATQDRALHRLIAQQLRATGFTIQLGAFSSEENAQRAARQIADQAQQMRMGLPRLVPVRDARGRELVLVQVGRFTTQSAALRAREKLGQASAMVVPLSGD